MKTSAAAVYRDENAHTCIRVSVDEKFTHYIPFSALELKVCHMRTNEFDREFTAIPDYAPQRAAEKYLFAGDGVRIAISDEARAHLQRLAGPAYDRSKDRIDDVTVEIPSSAPQQPKEFANMATKKTAPAKRLAKSHPEAKAAPAKKAKAAAVEAPKRGRKPTHAPNTVFTVQGGDAVKRGAFRAIVDVAEKLGAFTQAKLQTACSKVELREGQFENTFKFGVAKGIFVASA
jgi:biotin carboxyl carrier protein